MATERLAVKITSQAETDEVESFKEEITQLGASAAATSITIDELDDEIDELGTQSTTAAAQTSGLATALTSAGGAMAFLQTASATTLVTLGAVSAAVGGLALAFGAMGIAGVVAGFESLKDEATEAKQEIIPLVEAFGEDFVPMLETGINALPELTSEIIDAIGPTKTFRGTLRQLGETGMEVLPALAGVGATAGRGLAIGARPGLKSLEQLGAAANGLIDVMGALNGATGGLITKFAKWAGVLVRPMALITRYNTMVLDLVNHFRWLDNAVNNVGKSLRGLPSIPGTNGPLFGGGGGGGSAAQRAAQTANAQVATATAQGQPTIVQIGQINASGKQEGRRAGKSLKRELRGTTSLPDSQR